MESLQPEPDTASAFPYFKDPNGKFKQVISLAKTADIATYVFISENQGEFFGLTVDKGQEELLTLKQISNLLNEQLKDKAIQVTRSFFSENIDQNKSISYFQDSQPLYFRIISSYGIQVEVDEAISKEKNTVLNLKMSEEAKYLDFIDLISQKIDRPFTDLYLERKDTGVSITSTELLRPIDPSKNGMTITLQPGHKPGKEVMVYGSDTIDDIKKIVKKEWSFHPNQQTMIFSGKPLEDGHTLDSYGIKAGDKIHIFARATNSFAPGRIRCRKTELIKNVLVNGDKLLLKLSSKEIESQEIDIQVKTLTGKTIDFKINTNYTVEKLKELIEEKEKIPVDQQRIIYAGAQLDDSDVLCEYGVEDKSILHLVLRLRGGGGGNPFVDLSNPTGPINIDWSDNAPDWRVAAPGLCLEGVCNNKECIANEQMVVMPQNFGTFDLILDIKNAKCPICKQSVDPLACGFSSCLYTFCGVKLEGDGKHERVANQNWLEAGDFYQYYDPRESGIVQWLSLKIYTRYMPYNESEEEFAICLLCKQQITSADKRLECGHKSHEACLTKIQKNLTNSCLLCHLH